MDSHELAWAAGFFDGEGWAAFQGRGVRARINQAGRDGIPDVLLKFQRVVGVGRIKGPLLKEGKQPLYYWEATSRPDVKRVADLIAPWLCSTKRCEFERALGIPMPGPAWPGSMSEELAWAGGFFDGEGSTYLEKHRTHPGYFYPVMYVPQAADGGVVAPELLRFKSAVDDIGKISGVRQDRPDRKPYRRWRVVTPLKVQAALHLLSPFMGEVKRVQAHLVMRVIHAQPDLPRGNPAFGVAGTRFCHRGHDKWEARFRPFRGRGRNVENPGTYLHQCLRCVRDGARARRQKDRRPLPPT